MGISSILCHYHCIAALKAYRREITEIALKMVDTCFSMNHRIICLAIIFFLPLVAASFSNTPVLAASNFEAVTVIDQQETDGATSGDASSITRDEINVVAREIWCPLCSGVRLDVCELQACNQMREEIAIQLAQGADTEEIKSYFLAQYGPQILGEPPRSGFNWLAWIVPFASLLGVGLYLFITRRPQNQLDVVVDASDGSPGNYSGARTGKEAAEIAPDGQSHSPKDPTEDTTDYEQLLNNELEKYE